MWDLFSNSHVQGCSRAVVEALSTHVGCFCRIDTSSNVVVCTTEAGEGSEMRVLSSKFLVLSWKILSRKV